MIIIGVDIGIAITGIGIIEKKGNSIKYIDHNTILTHKDLSVPKRLQILEETFNKYLTEYKPEIVAVEELFFFKNAKTVINVAQARGVVLLGIEKYGALLKEFTPLQVKQAVSSYGRADKLQVQKMIKMLLNLKEIPKPDDAADALALAWCCASFSAIEEFKLR